MSDLGLYDITKHNGLWADTKDIKSIIKRYHH